MRTWTPYELNQLIKHGFAIDSLEEYGEMPVEYITGWAEFAGLEFMVSPAVLIPRIESLELIDLAEEFCQHKDNPNMADVACGSGCLGVALTMKLDKKGRKYSMVLSDISPSAVEIAKKNSLGAMLFHLPGVILSDLFVKYPEGVKFDLVMANLPYIPSRRLKSLPKSVIDYEPRLALDGGPDGLAVIKRLLQQLSERLAPGGTAILEIDETRKLTDFDRFWNDKIKIQKDQFGKNRFLIAYRTAL